MEASSLWSRSARCCADSHRLYRFLPLPAWRSPPSTVPSELRRLRFPRGRRTRSIYCSAAQPTQGLKTGGILVGKPNPSRRMPYNPSSAQPRASWTELGILLEFLLEFAARRAESCVFFFSIGRALLS